MTTASVTGLALFVLAILAALPALLIAVQALTAWVRVLLPGRPPPSPAPAVVLAVVVPAHDEAGGIAETVEKVLAAAAADRIDLHLLVVADNCTDDTAGRARGAGARVLERNDPARRGKGYALARAVEELRPEPWDGLVVLDADARPCPGFFAAVAREIAANTPAMQAFYWMDDGAGAGARTAMMRVAFALINGARPLGRYALGGSSQITGNGFALSRACLERVPFTPSAALAEDLEHGLAVVAAGFRVKPLPRARVSAAPAPDKAGAASQRTRWEAGRRQAARTWLPRLLAARTWPALESAIDLLVPPLGLVVLALLVVAALAVLFGHGPALAVTLAGLALPLLAVVAALRVTDMPLSALLSLRHVPAFLLWKVAVYASPRFWAQRAWVRTNREAGGS